AMGGGVVVVALAAHGHKLAKHRIAHAGLACGRRMAGNAITTAVGDTDGNVEHLLDEGIERAWGHHLLDALPGPPQQRRIAGQPFPEIIDVGDGAGALDVVPYGAHLGTGWAGSFAFYLRLLHACLLTQSRCAPCS